ncbi:MAG TPA: pyridoxal 5'-phosphate synthase glutaminase subunit PdxT [Dehalococcoidales bacterium]|nr:pyridoxal 5'-phosphate synthase glutaminase subunit PdxT [Dehalococcoidales bacterium]
MKIGVLALQGAFAEHIDVLRRLGVEATEVRLPEQLAGLDGLIIPGGESTTFKILMQNYSLEEPLERLAAGGFPIYGTCAGMIMLAKELSDARGVTPIGVMDIKVRRNAFGRQVDSFEADVPIEPLGEKPFHCVFIRAPLIEWVSKKVKVLARLENGEIIAARQGKMLVTSFHPELTDDARIHRYFIDVVGGKA